MKIFAFIFARAGSKGLKNKNIKKFNKKPLINYTIDFAKKSKFFDKIILSSDKKSILKYGEKKNIYTIQRPKKLSQDNSPELTAWKHAVKFIKRKNLDFDLMVVLPVTSPLRILDDIKRSVKKINKSNTDLVITISESSRHPAFNIVKKIKNNLIQLYDPKNKNIFRRQDVKKIYNISTISYVLKPEYVLKAKNLLEGRVRAIEVPQIRAIDIDNIYDFKIAEYLYKELRIK